MPIYEYRCSSCGHELEALRKFSDAPLVTCPSCGAEALVKKVSAAGFQLKGSGWYVTDFRGAAKPGKTEGASADAAKGADTSAGGDAKDSKRESASKSDSTSSSDSASKSESTTKSDSKSDTSGGSAPPAKPKTTTAST